mgnify:CR=1 FL=1
MAYHEEWGSIRTPLMLIMFIALLTSFLVGGVIPLNKSLADYFFKVMEEMKKEVLVSESVLLIALRIFAHNATTAVLMLVPFLGLAWGLVTLFTTGLTANAVLTLNGITSSLFKLSYLLLLLAQPHSILELAAYSLLSSESVMLTISFKGGHLKEEALKALKVALVSFLMLLIAAVVEAYVICLHLGAGKALKPSPFPPSWK